ncbi:MAG: long-chain-acyl-CoA synthetase [Patulibacter sp.]|nr:long-chain-acyl-CoA synthetase [Patulibacter sp.]
MHRKDRGPRARTEAVDARTTVRGKDILRALPAMTPDLPTLLRGGKLFATLKGTSKRSIGLAFQQQATKHPERIFIRFEGRDISYGEANARVNQYAAVLADRGVTVGSVVGVLSTNRPETLLVALAVVKLGAVAGLMNHNQRGAVLDHSFGLLEATVVVVGAEVAEALDTISVTPAPTVLGLPEGGDLPAGLESLDALADAASTANPDSVQQVIASSTAFYVFTSGTTGMPKASRMSHMRWLKAGATLGDVNVRLKPEDTLYCCLPLYHNNAVTVSLSSVITAGATIAIGRKFSVSRFWDHVRENDATAFCYIGELCRFLLNQPPSRGDKDHRIRVIVGNGLRPEIWDDFQQRFGIPRIGEFYGASEGNLVFFNAFNLKRTAGVCPLPFAVLAVDPMTELPERGPDGFGRRVKPGEVGLLVTKITNRVPFDGYTDAKATESKILRDLLKTGDQWFNTGDLVLNQGFKHIAFADRLGDTFRWKGENVATTEVEAALLRHPAVEDAVAFGVEIPDTDGRAGMVALKLRADAEFDGQDVAQHVLDTLPAYAVPLFVRLIEEVEQTSTFKSRKVELRNEAYSPEQVSDPLFVLGGRDAGYIPHYDDYARDVASSAVRV